VRLTIFVHSLLLAWCSISVGTVLAAKGAAKDSQTGIGAVSKQAVAIEVADSAIAGVHAVDSLTFGHASEAGQALWVAAGETAKTAPTQVSGQASPASKVKSNSKTNPTHSSTHSSKKSNVQNLDVEAEKALQEVLDLSSDLAIISEQHVNPAKNQLLVLVTLQPTQFFELDYVELEVDRQMVAAYPYTDKDISAMVRGGGHRLYLANLPAGVHELKAMFVGKAPRDPDYRQEASYQFISGAKRTLIELYINNGDKGNALPQFMIREWD